MLGGSRPSLAYLVNLGCIELHPWAARTDRLDAPDVVVPIRRGPGVDVVRAFADAVAAEVASAHAGLATASHRKADKAARAYIDTLRNGWAQTTVAPYSVRARRGAPVSTPLAWDEVGPALDPSALTLRTLLARLAARGDLFRPVLDERQRLPRV